MSSWRNKISTGVRLVKNLFSFLICVSIPFIKAWTLSSHLHFFTVIPWTLDSKEVQGKEASTQKCQQLFPPTIHLSLRDCSLHPSLDEIQIYKYINIWVKQYIWYGKPSIIQSTAIRPKDAWRDFSYFTKNLRISVVNSNMAH